jgi:hypothetical protein
MHKKNACKKKKTQFLANPIRNEEIKKKTKINPGQPELTCKTRDPIHKVRIA